MVVIVAVVLHLLQRAVVQKLADIPEEIRGHPEANGEAGKVLSIRAGFVGCVAKLAKVEYEALYQYRGLRITVPSQ